MLTHSFIPWSKHICRTVTCLYINTGTNTQRENTELTLKCLFVCITKSLSITVQSLSCCKTGPIQPYSGQYIYLADQLHLPFIYRWSDIPEKLSDLQILSLLQCHQPTLCVRNRYQAVSVHYYSMHRSLTAALFPNSSKSWLCIVNHILKSSWAIQHHLKAIIIIVLL